MKPRAQIGVFGGSGFYSFFKRPERVRAETPYGFPSSTVTISKVGEKNVAFLPRHGVHHEYPPHMVPYRANLRAFKDLGVTRVIGPCAVGSLRPEVKPGDLVFCNQFVNFTNGRRDTFYDGPETTHVGLADPYCPELRRIGLDAAKRLKMKAHEGGTVVVIQGPRFSTRSESKFFSAQGWDVINMTQYPEVALARELEMCYLNISVVTDYDVGLEGNRRVKPVSHGEVIRVFEENIGKLRNLISEVVRMIPEKRKCDCGRALEHARLST